MRAQTRVGRSQPALQCRFTCSSNSFHDPTPRCGRICRAKWEPGALTSSLQRYAAHRRARRESVGEVAAVLQDVFEGARRVVDWGRRWARHGLSRLSGTRVRRWCGNAGESGESGESDVWVRQAVAWRTAAACYKVMLTPLPAASLTACLASSVRPLSRKL